MLYIQNRDNYTLGVIENFYNDTHQKILSSGVSTYDFTVSKNQDYTEFLVEGNYVVLADDNGEGWKFTIMNKTETHKSITVQCDDIGLELLNTVQDAWSSPTSKQPIEYYIKKAVKKTEWTININEISSLERTLKWEGRDTSLARLLSIATEFDNAELEFKVEFKNLRVVKQYINIFKARGINKSEVQLIYGDTVDDITKTTSITDLRTALKGVGSAKEIPEGSPEGTVEEHVDFSGIHYDDGEYFSPAGDPFLYARTANQQFNIQEKYIEDFYEYDTSDAQELLNRTITQLKKASVPLINYEVSVVTFNQSLELGDTVTIIDHDYQPELLLNARVLQINKSYTDSSLNSIILGNFIILESSIDSRLSTLQNQLQSINIKPNYTWLRYAIDDKGNGMTSIPTADTQYVAILANKKTGIPSDDPTDYAGHWQLIKGSDGSDGIPGPKGEDGRTSYTHFAYADNVSGTKDFSVDNPTGRSYMGVYSDFTKADSTNPSDYVWSYTKGETGPEGMQGAQGPKGDVGIPGKPGIDGKTPYTHVAYADNDEGGGFSQSPDNKAYMGWYSDYTETDSTDVTKYAWSLIKGADGKDGADGVAGKDGVGVKTTTITYTQSTSGTTPPTTGWTANVPTLIKGQYLWTKTVWMYTDGSAETGYTVSYNAKDGNTGSDGRAGKDGVGIKSTAITYAQSTSGTVAPTTGYTTTVPSVAAGSFLWTKTTWSYTDGTSESGYSVAKMGEKGAQGPQGLQGLQGATGNQGIQGLKGLDGKSSYTHIAYANSSDSERNMNNWVLSEPAKNATTITYKNGVNTIDYTGVGDYEIFSMPIHTKVGNKVSVTFGYTQPAVVDLNRSNNGVPVSFSNQILEHSAIGDNPIYLGVNTQSNKVYTISTTATSETMYLSFNFGYLRDGTNWKFRLSVQQDFSQDPGNHEYMGWYSDFTQADSNDPSLYGWSLIKGANGSDGTPGKAGTDGKTPYFHTAWATSADGRTGFSTTDSANKSYLGTYTDFTVADSTDATKYAWSLIKGRDGVDGANGAPGKAGADGKTPYFHQAWADSKDGKINFSTTDPSNRGYLGTYTDYTQADSTDPTKYFWVELVGAIEIGGRNYLADTDTPWQARGSGGTNQTSAGKWQFTFGTIKQAPFKDGEYVTVSFDYISVGTGAYGTILPQLNNTPWGQLGGGDAMKDNGHVVRTVQWKSGWTSGTATGIQIRMDNVATTRTITVYNMQFERGNKDTDHKAAPEDTQKQIDSVNQGLRDTNSKIAAVTKVDSQATAPTNPKKGDQWWVKDANGNINAFKIWDGTKWADSIIQQSAMNISTLNGNTINGALINGSKFTNNFDYTGPDKNHFQGVTQIKDGAVNITWKIPENNQTGHTSIDASGLESIIRNPKGTIIRSAKLQMGQLQLSNGRVSGSLNEQDSYRNSTDTVAWLGGWGDWGYGRGLIHVVRNGRLVTLSGYPHHNNTTAMGNVFQLPAWAKPAAGINISAVCYNSGVGNAIACRIFIDNDGLASINGGQSGGYVVIGASYVGKDM